MALRALLLLLSTVVLAAAPKVYTYVGSVGPDYVILAWGTASGPGNTIGRDSTPIGRARIELGSLKAAPDRNWVRLEGLAEDTVYPYRVWIDGNLAGEGTVRTWPRKADKLAFFVMGDFGTGGSGQYRIAKAMAEEERARSRTDNPVRFVLTTGDNLYGDRTWVSWRRINTGDQDRHWRSKFFVPYELILRSIPFFPTLGNHDGNMSESTGDLAAYLDNFFFPGGEPARYYRFSYGDLADFYGLDTSSNSEAGPPRLMYGAGSRQDEWLRDQLAGPPAPWRIPYFHHPPLSAGPRHTPFLKALAHWMELFTKAGVRVVFSGHEHNFQFSEASRETGGVRYIVTGAGGSLRSNSVLGRMQAARIEGWAPQRHFLLVTIAGETMEITPLADLAVDVRNSRNERVPMPLRISR
jgi:hypothetical protein